jgi:hypothetical protein
MGGFVPGVSLLRRVNRTATTWKRGKMGWQMARWNPETGGREVPSEQRAVELVVNRGKQVRGAGPGGCL